MGGATGRCCSVAPAKGQGRGGATMAAPLFAPVRRPSGFRLGSIEEFRSRYTEGGVLRRGSTVTALTSTDLGQRSYCCRALKLKAMPCQDMTAVAQHLDALSCLEHPHVCRFVEAFQDGERLLLVYERAHPLPLFEHVMQRGSLTEEEAADYLRQAAMALAVAHSQGIVHGRLSPKSLILAYDDDGEEDVTMQIKVCDMGQGLLLRPGLLEAEATEKSLEVERYALSPEVAWRELLPTGQASLPPGAEKNDIWALGVVFYHMLSGTVPFKGVNRQEIQDQVVSKEVSFHDKMWGLLSADARDVIEFMLRVNPGIRVSAASVLRHDWVRVPRAPFPRRHMVELLSNVAVNVQEGEFKRFVLRVIGEQLPDDDRAADIVEQAFRCLDRNSDGVLTVSELVRGLKKHLQRSDDERDLARLFARVDRDSSGTVNVQEFVCASLSQEKSTSLPVLWEAFNAFDKNHDGNVTFEEIDEVVQEIEGSVRGQEQVESLAREIRRELSGVCRPKGLDFEDFVSIMSAEEPSAASTVRKDLYRVLWGCGVDCYKVRHCAPASKLDVGRSKSALSAYRRRSCRKELQPASAG